MFRALSERGYRLFAGAQMASMIGLWVQRVVQDWTVLELTGSAALVGMLVLMQFGPNLLFGMWGGLIVDRGAVRKILLIVQCGATVVSVVLCVFAFTGNMSTELIFGSVLVMGVLSVLEMPARQVFVGELVSVRSLPNAISMNATIFQTGTMLGPAIGGLLIPVGISWAFLIAALLQGASVVLLFAISAPLRPRVPAPRNKGQIVEALQYCRRKPQIFWTLFLLMFVALIGLNWPVLLTSMADRVFHSGGTGYGLYTSAGGAWRRFGGTAVVAALARALAQCLPLHNCVHGVQTDFGVCAVADRLRHLDRSRRKLQRTHVDRGEHDTAVALQSDDSRSRDVALYSHRRGRPGTRWATARHHYRRVRHAVGHGALRRGAAHRGAHHRSLPCRSCFS